MKIDFLQHAQEERLILIFAGWSTTPALYAHVEMPGWDVAVVSGEDCVAPDFEVLRGYSTVYLYAWSMGVYFAMRMLPDWLNPVACYAVNGTPSPCHDTLGIPCEIFLGTARGLTSRSLEKFRMRMCGSASLYRELQPCLDGGDVTRLAKQLLDVSDGRDSERAVLKWRAAYVSEEDHIFPPENQKRAWHGVTEVRSLTGPHYVDLASIVHHTVIDVERVGERFTRSLPTYTQHAHAQRLIAERLASLMGALAGRDVVVRSLIEIGSGTGLFTRAWSALVKAETAHFMDLCDMPEYGVASKEIYTQADAEREIERLVDEEAGTIDAIVSASAIQWFANPQRFLANCHRLLRHGGILALSTFAPGNLEELHGLRADPMYYPEAEDMRGWLRNYSEAEVREERVTVEFSTPMEALRHLRLTGVTGSGAQAGAAGVRRFVERYPKNERGRYSLTFRPLYLLARK